jgi:ATP-dependent DNA helicase PIF1
MEDNLAVRPTKLFPTRNKVEQVNTREMNALTTEELEYKLKYHSDLEMTAAELRKRHEYSREQIQTELLYLKGNLRCDEVVRLKIGSQVMCIVNIELDNGQTLCNGSQGIITGLTEQGLPIVKFGAFETVMGYHVWPSENIPGIGVSQLPLILAWALTIHKSQGATLDIAEIDAGSGIFECGQTYVALSRVKSLEGLYLTSFDASKIKVNRKVQEFYALISGKDDSKTSGKDDSKTSGKDDSKTSGKDALVSVSVSVTAIPIVIAVPIL